MLFAAFLCSQRPPKNLSIAIGKWIEHEQTDLLQIHSSFHLDTRISWRFSTSLNPPSNAKNPRHPLLLKAPSPDPLVWAVPHSQRPSILDEDQAGAFAEQKCFEQMPWKQLLQYISVHLLHILNNLDIIYSIDLYWLNCQNNIREEIPIKNTMRISSILHGGFSLVPHPRMSCSCWPGQGAEWSFTLRLQGCPA